MIIRSDIEKGCLLALNLLGKYSTYELAEQFGVSESTLRGWKTKFMKRSITIGDLMQIDETIIEQFLICAAREGQGMVKENGESREN